jgi:ribosomal protein S16
MPKRIKLKRHGKKGKPFYWVVAADSRAKRDGKFLEKIGTARAILSYKGALLKHHLDDGVKKGALTQEQADAKLATWLAEKSIKTINPIKKINVNNNIINEEVLNDNLLEKEYEIISNVPFSKTVKISGTITSVTKYNPTIVID